MTDSLSLDGRGPLHEQIRRAVCAPIVAMRALADDGLIVRRRRTGSIVAAPAGDRVITAMVSVQTAVEAGGHAYSYEGLARHRARATDDIAERFNIPVGTPLLNISCRHFANGEPAALEDHWINLNTLPEAVDEMFGAMPPGQWLAMRLPWPKSSYVVTAVNAGARIAKLLGLAPGTACLKIDRRSWRDGVPATFVTCLYPGAGHALTGEVAPP
jgi:GntR family histidine utilization transcriptional repressor